MYRHTDNLGLPVDLPVGKVMCVGRNYLDHITEMQSQVPVAPLLFMKPKTALCHLTQPVSIPADQGVCHNEVEIAVLIGQTLCKAPQGATDAELQKVIWGVGVGLDLTLRDVQAQLKADGHPWERAKAFDFSCPVSGFVLACQIASLQSLPFSLSVNNEVRQQGNSADMMRPVLNLLVQISQQFTLEPGDIVMTGTPKGVGPLCHGDKLAVQLADFININTHVVTI